MNIEQERDDFEAWAKDHYVLQRSAYNDTYISVPTMRAWDVWQARAALQSQDREDAIPAEIRLMAERIAADDFEHCTADPIFTVEKQRVIAGIDTDYTDQVGWFDTDSGFRIADDEAESFEGNYSDTGEEPEGYVRTGYLEEWEHCATFITMQAAQEFAKAKGENYRVYVDSGCRNHEWKALRAFLLSIDHARRVEGDSDV